MNNTLPKYSPYAAWLAVEDIDKSVEIYCNCFGYEFIESRYGDDGIAGYAELSFQNMTLLLSVKGSYAEPVVTPKDGNYWPSITLYQHTENIEKTYETCVEYGLEVVRTPETTPWGHRLIEVLDLDRYSWMLYKEIA